jgi:hypothetical protein
MLRCDTIAGKGGADVAFADKKRMIEYNDQYKREHYDRIDVRFRKGGKALIQTAAEAAGETVSVYIKRSVAARLEEDGLVVPEDF